MKSFKRKSSGTGKGSEPENALGEDSEIKAVYTKEAFSKRYREENFAEVVLEGAMKMVGSYFLDTKMAPRVEAPINHPANLDQAIEEGLGFELYCRALGLPGHQAAMLLAIAFTDFMVRNHGFKLFRDAEPEHPQRDLSLKYQHQGTWMSLYPVEYAAKALDFGARFEDLHQKVEKALHRMPNPGDYKDGENPGT